MMTLQRACDTMMGRRVRGSDHLRFRIVLDWSLRLGIFAVLGIYWVAGCTDQSGRMVQNRRQPSIVGLPAESPTLRSDLDGQSGNLLFFFCGCMACRGMVADLNDGIRLAPKLRFWGVTEMGPADRDAFKRATGAAFSLMADPGGEIARSLGVVKCPTVMIVQRGRRCASWSPAGNLRGSIRESQLWARITIEGAWR